MTAALLGLCLGAAVAYALWLRAGVSRVVAVAEDAAGRVGAGPPLVRFSAAMRRLVERAADPDRRSAQTHSITGLPTREPLFARMAADGRGVVAVLAFRDYDRLCAFDPKLGDRVLAAQVARLRTMLPPALFLAHVDRGHLAIWSAEDGVGTDGRVDALVYALGDQIVDGDRTITPEVAVRRVAFDADRGDPQAALTRALSSFATVAADGGDDQETIAREHYLLEQELRQAVAHGELALQFQPLIDAAEGRVCGAEALIRWRNPVRGLVPPSRFVPVMEAAGLSNEIGLWALNAAVREARGWSAAGLPGLRVAVNVSGHQLREQELDLLVERTLARHSATADLLEIELTESVALGDGEESARLFAALHALGVRIAIDDFGTGHSSLSTLRTLAFDKIKIDREFVTDVQARRDSQAICQSVIALGRGLGIRVLAEGVETRAEYEWLRRHGCQHFQGFYFSPPLDGAGFTDFVRDGERLARLLAIDPSGERRVSERLRA